jgi:hypothetical protein
VSARTIRLRRAGQAVTVLVVIDLAIVLFLAWQWSHASQDDVPGTYDAVAVLHADRAELGARTERSMHRAVALYREGRARSIVYLRGNRPTRRLHAGRQARERLAAQSVPLERILSEDDSFDTPTNLDALARIARRESFASVALIAHPAHRARVAYHAERKLSEIRVQILAPAPAVGFAAQYADAVLSCHHELVAWTLTLLLPEQTLEDLMRVLRR